MGLHLQTSCASKGPESVESLAIAQESSREDICKLQYTNIQDSQEQEHGMLKIPYEKISKHSIWKIALILAEELESPNERKKHKACSKNKCEFSNNTVPTPDKSNDNLQQKCHSKENQKLCSFCGLKHRLGQAFCTSFGKKMYEVP